MLNRCFNFFSKFFEVQSIYWVLKCVFCLVFAPLQAQHVLTLQEAIEQTLKNAPNLLVANLQTQQSRELQGAAMNIPPLSVFAESPTGDFYTIGAAQNFDFPSVYTMQKKIAQQQTLIQDVAKEVLVNDIKFLVKNAYLQAQYEQAKATLFAQIDTVYRNISQSATRQFEAGQIDALAKNYARAESSRTTMHRIAAQKALEENLNLLKIYTGNSNLVGVEALTAYPLPDSGKDIAQNNIFLGQTLAIEQLEQIKNAEEMRLRLEKNKALPSFNLGYLNQSNRNSPFGTRFSLGLQLPLWRGQYKSQVAAAKTGIAIAQQNITAKEWQMRLAWQEARANVAQYQTEWQYYEAEGQEQANELINIANRFFKAGQTDYLAYLRTLRDAFEVKTNRLESLKEFNKAILQIQYLMENL